MGRANRRAALAAASREAGGFSAWPHACASSPYFYRLSNSAKALLFDLLGQLRRDNNGNLTCAYTVLHRRGWKSKATVQRARDELLKSGWIVVTRYGGLGITELYALTFHAICECEGKVTEYGAAGRPLGHWKTGVNPDYKQKVARKFLRGQNAHVADRVVSYGPATK